MPEPPITIRARYSSFNAGDNANPTRVVVHATCPDVGYSKASAPGTAHGTALYFASASAGGSAHYVCGVDGEEHCVPDDTIAYHAPPNPGSLGVEITAEGGNYAKNYSRDQWLSDSVWPAVQRAAARVRDLCQRHGVPMVKLTAADLLAGEHGICGHVDVSQAWHQSDHSDPGASTFPWDRFMAEVTGPPQEGFLMALTDAQQAEIYAVIHGLSTINPPYTKEPTPTQLILGDIFVQARLAAANSDPAKLVAALTGPLTDSVKAALAGSGAQVDADAIASKVVADLAGRLAS